MATLIDTSKPEFQDPSLSFMTVDSSSGLTFTFNYGDTPPLTFEVPAFEAYTSSDMYSVQDYVPAGRFNILKPYNNPLLTITQPT